MSLNDVPGVRAAFAMFDMEAVDTTYSIQGGERFQAKEVFISNRAKEGSKGSIKRG